MTILSFAGGYIVNVTRTKHFETVDDYIHNMENLMESLENEGRWRKISRKTFSDYHPGVEGVTIVYQVL